MEKLIFATNNKHKISEVKNLLKDMFDVSGVADLGYFDDIPENQKTLEGNAVEKAEFIYNKFGVCCFADDTGLEVEALNGAPGVYSARYAGNDKNSLKNMQKLLKEMQSFENRKARFRCVIALIIDGEKHIFEGIVNGKILDKPLGNDGFGYDPVFCADGYNISFAQMDMDEKNKISHRGSAVRKLVDFLSNK